LHGLRLLAALNLAGLVLLGCILVECASHSSYGVAEVVILWIIVLYIIFTLDLGNTLPSRLLCFVLYGGVPDLWLMRDSLSNLTTTVLGCFLQSNLAEGYLFNLGIWSSVDKP
jgi:hypothetical protein